MTDLVPVKRALLSVSDKTGLVDFAHALSDEFGVTLLSTGGTAQTLREAGLPVTDVSDVTGFPEMMAGRVKTLHPKIHGAILGRLPEDAAVMAEHGIEPIDLVCVNLYPFEQTVAKPGVTYEEAVENIDIGGPSMVRSAAKNHARVLVVTSPARYDKVLGDLRQHGGASCFKHRQKMAARAFGHSAAYDSHIWTHLGEQVRENSGPDALDDAEAIELSEEAIGAKEIWVPTLQKVRDLRYGENPHQKAAIYAFEGGDAATLADATQVHGKELSYINLLDADAALAVVREFDGPACCIVKHASPCGVGSGDTPRASFDAAYASDPLAAFGGIVAFNTPVDAETAGQMIEGGRFLEVVVATAYEADALEMLMQRWKNIRLLRPNHADDFSEANPVMFHQIDGGLLVQQRDLVGVVESEWKVVSTRTPTTTELAALKFTWLACKHVKSNAVVIGGEHGTCGIGGGQVDRVAAAEQAVKKAGERARGAVAASDAFFPFPDGPKALLDAGVTAIVQPGGSVKDQLTIDLVNGRGAAMIFTGRRHFRH